MPLLYRSMLAIVSLCLCQASSALPSLTLSCLLPQDQAAYPLLQGLLNQAFEPLGYQVQLVDLPTEQVIDGLRSGRLDGDCGRAYNFDQLTGLNLIKVASPLRNTSLSPWALAGRPQLKQQPRSQLRAAYYAPGLALASLVGQLGYAEVLPVADTAAGFALLDQGRVDLFYGYDFAVASYFARRPIQPYQNLGAAMIVPVHLFLHPRHAALAGQLAAHLVQLLVQTPIPAATPQAPDSKLKPFRMVCVAELESDEFPVIEHYYREIFARLGYQLLLDYEPPQRAAASLRRRLYDGLCGGTDNFNQLWDLSLLRVGAPVAHLALQAWSTDPALQVLSPQALSGRRVALVRGYPLTLQLLEDIQLQSQEEVTSTGTGLKMLAAKRVDIFLGIDFFVQHSLNRLSLSEAVFGSGLLHRFDVYTYLQPEFAELVTPMEQVIRARGPL